MKRKIQIQRKQLQIVGETVRELDLKQLPEVAGGVNSIWKSPTWCLACAE